MRYLVRRCTFFGLLLFVLLITSFLSLSGIANAQEVVLTGTLKVKISDDMQGDRTKLEYTLHHGKSRTHLRFKVRPSMDLVSEMQVRVKGKKVGAGGSFSVGGNKESIQVVSGGAPEGLSGVKQAVVLRIQSASAVSPATHAQLASEVAAANARAAEHSFGLVSIANDKDNNGIADVFTVQISDSSAGVGETQAFTFCNQAKAASGVSGYDHYICILPPDMNYGWYGQAYINGTDMVINGNYASGYPNGLLHEIGHNWGRHHANNLTTEYGDGTCIMGGNAGTANRHFNGPQKLGLGWISAATVGSGLHTIAPVESTTGQRLLKIHDGVANEDLYISTRARLGSFSSGPINPGTTHIHRWAGGASRTYIVAVLGTGQSYSQNGITIGQQSHDGTNAVVQIGTECIASVPGLTIAPSSIMTNTTAEQSYSVVIQNRDQGCADPVQFQLNSSSSHLLLGTALSSSTVSILPGQSASVTLFARPSIDLPSGAHTLSLSASAAGHTTSSGQVQFILDTLAPSQVINLAGSVAKRKVTLGWTASTDQGSAGLLGYEVFRNGIKVGSPTANAFTEAPGNGVFTYTVRAVDKAGNLGAFSSGLTLSIGRK